ncbi:MAG: DUF4249 domain-containing protein [Paludibacter sp.]|nr:DUF4249 domain-containing protein [Paludibacter sp.]
MIYLKKICFVVLLIITLIGCTEVYIPEVNNDTQALIVEGLITDGAGPFTIKLSMAKPLSFDSVGAAESVLDAKLVIMDNEDRVFILDEAGSGNYSTPTNFKPQIGNSYKLHIETTDGSIYESKVEKLLPPQSLDSIRGFYTTNNYLNANNELLNATGADICVDLFKSLSATASVPSCRFVSNVTVQYQYRITGTDEFNNPTNDWFWFYFGWDTFNLNGTENITDEKVASPNPVKQNHSIGFMPLTPANYGFSIPYESLIVYYLRVNQYTMNSDSYRFYKDANTQLSANGKIFDPIASQLYGNMKCVNNSSKIVLGLFEVSSVKLHAFILRGSSYDQTVSVYKAPIVDVPSAMFNVYKIWAGIPSGKPQNDPYYTPIPFPGWWYHN